LNCNYPVFEGKFEESGWLTIALFVGVWYSYFGGADGTAPEYRKPSESFWAFEKAWFLRLIFWSMLLSAWMNLSSSYYISKLTSSSFSIYSINISFLFFRWSCSLLINSLWSLNSSKLSLKNVSSYVLRSSRILSSARRFYWSLFDFNWFLHFICFLSFPASPESSLSFNSLISVCIRSSSAMIPFLLMTAVAILLWTIAILSSLSWICFSWNYIFVFKSSWSRLILSTSFIFFAFLPSSISMPAHLAAWCFFKSRWWASCSTVFCLSRVSMSPKSFLFLTWTLSLLNYASCSDFLIKTSVASYLFVLMVKLLPFMFAYSNFLLYCVNFSFN